MSDNSGAFQVIIATLMVVVLFTWQQVQEYRQRKAQERQRAFWKSFTAPSQESESMLDGFIRALRFAIRMQPLGIEPGEEIHCSTYCPVGEYRHLAEVIKKRVGRQVFALHRQIEYNDKGEEVGRVEIPLLDPWFLLEAKRHLRQVA